MVQEYFSFLSHDGRTHIHATKWLPDNRQWKAVLQITHGMLEYIERYTAFAEFLTARGYLVTGHDHLGHGASILTKADYGYFAEKRPSDCLIEDMHTLRKQVQKENEGLPYFMFGHSMGSYMLRKYMTLYGENLQGVILCGTGSMPDILMKTGMGICKLFAKCKGWHYRSTFVQKLSFMGAYKQYDVSGKQIEKNWLTKDFELAAKFYKDPKSSFLFTVNGYYGLMEAVYYDNQMKNIAKIPKQLPIFLISGDKDPVGNMGKAVKLVYEQYEKAGLSDVTWKLYEDARHELLNETNRQEIYEEIAAWLEIHGNTTFMQA